MPSGSIVALTPAEDSPRSAHHMSRAKCDSARGVSWNAPEARLLSTFAPAMTTATTLLPRRFFALSPFYFFSSPTLLLQYFPFLHLWRITWAVALASNCMLRPLCLEGAFFEVQGFMSHTLGSLGVRNGIQLGPVSCTILPMHSKRTELVPLCGQFGLLSSRECRPQPC